MTTQSVSWQLGDVIADLYEIREVIGTGGMGVVYRVWHRGWQVELAVKTPRAQLLDSPAHVRNFEEEAEAWVGLGVHPNTVSCVYVRQLEGAPRVFAEWVDGGSLADAIRTRRLYEGDRVLGRLLDVAIQFAWGLDHAHAQGLVHQDVKPANVMLARDGTVKVTDFGLAKARAMAGEAPGGPAGASVLAGYGGMTPAYCSPEQAAAAQDPALKLTRATDVWSWAISVWEMFAGEPPCRFGQTAGAVFESFVADGRRMPGIPPLPSQLATLLGRCLTMDPAARPKPMGGLAHDLIELYADLIGERYPRPWPGRADLRADQLSNHALSLLDLGRPEHAERLWGEALAVDRHHPHALYNYGLHRWRDGRISDTELIAELEAARERLPADPVVEYLLGLVQLERGDTAAAREHLDRAAHRAPGNSEIGTARRLARELPDEPESIALHGHGGAVDCVSISADGRVAASGSSDGAVRVWDLEVGSCRQVLLARSRIRRRDSAIDAVAMNGDGSLVVGHAGNGALLVWDATTGRRIHRFDGVRATSLAISEEGRIAVSGGAPGGPVRVWDVLRGKGIRTLRDEHTSPASTPGSIALTADGRLAIDYDAGEGETRIWEVESGRLVHSVDRFAGVTVNAETGWAISRQSATVAGARQSRMPTFWIVETTRTMGSAKIPPDRLSGPCALGPEGRVVMTVGSAPSRTTVAVWEPRSGRCLRTFHGHTGPITSIALSRDGRTAVSGSHDGTVRVWPCTPAGPSGSWSFAGGRVSH